MGDCVVSLLLLWEELLQESATAYGWGGGRKRSLVLYFAKVKPWTIIRRFDRNRAHSLSTFYCKVEGATKLKFAPFYSP